MPCYFFDRITLTILSVILDISGIVVSVFLLSYGDIITKFPFIQRGGIPITREGIKRFLLLFINYRATFRNQGYHAGIYSYTDPVRLLASWGCSR